MKTLQEEYKDDKALLKFYEKKLLIPGWAGQLDDAEAAYVANALRNDRKLFLQWRRAGRFKGLRRNVSPETAQKMALALLCRGVDFDKQGEFLNKGILKQKRGGRKPSGDTPTNFETNIIRDPSVLDSSITGPGRPRITSGEMSRITAWRRQKEEQGRLKL